MSAVTREFRLPDLGEGLPEAELVQWSVAVGDHVTLNQTIAEVETAKAVVELPSPYEGIVQSLHADAGDVIAVGSVVITFGVDGADDEGRVDSAAEAAEDGGGPNLVGYGAAPSASGPPRRRTRKAPTGGSAPDDEAFVRAAAPHDVLPMQHESVDVPPERPRSTPPVRKYARDRGIDISVVPPTGPHGVVTRADVDAFATVETAPQEAAVSTEQLPVGRAPRETRIPIRGVRKHTAEAMVRSAFTAPHVTVFLTVDITETMRFITSLREDRSLTGHRFGVLTVAAKAVCVALRQHPELNSSWHEDAGEIVQFGYVNLGIAAATDRGLVVPHVPDADALNLIELSDAIGELAQTARSGRTSPERMRGGTFTITNVGVFGVDAGTPILNPGEAGILALGAVSRRPWEFEGAVALRDVTTLALSFDHRLVDGEQGARFLAAVGAILRDPARAMLFG